MAADLPVGEELGWKSVQRPDRTPLRGSHVLVRPVEPESDAAPLFAVSHPPDGDLAIWTYMPDGPYESADQMRRALELAQASEDPLFFTLALLPAERPVGIASYLRITPEHGVIEIGCQGPSRIPTGGQLIPHACRAVGVEGSAGVSRSEGA